MIEGLLLPGWAQGLFAFFIGACVGSFLNVVIIRLPRGRSIIQPSSRCGFCGTSLRMIENIPLLSFWILRGMCKKCSSPFSIRYFAVELLTAILFLSVWSVYGWTLQSILVAAFVAALVAMTFIDLELRLIPDELSLGGAALAALLLVFASSHWPTSLWQGVAGGLLGFCVLWLMARAYRLWRGEDGLGGGDIKLMLLIGLMWGVQGVVTTLLVGSVVGALFGMIAIALSGKTKHHPIPFGPYLALGTMVHVFHLDRWIYL